MSYGAPFATSNGGSMPSWHKEADEWVFEKKWCVDKKWGRSLSDVQLNGTSFNDPYQKYDASAQETLQRTRHRLKHFRRGTPGCAEHENALASTWGTLTSSGFEPHGTLVHPSFKRDMQKTGMTFTMTRGCEPGATLLESLQAKKRNPAMKPSATFSALIRDRDRRHFEWDSSLPAGPPVPDLARLQTPKSWACTELGSRSGRRSITSSPTLSTAPSAFNQTRRSGSRDAGS
mmetsp:Transcript_44657/g.123783  ORF Transcript_44657/g.123783 Transcript_44657/m.123783 type:complete len:232 (-) Transcript_44657:76-771(-)